MSTPSICLEAVGLSCGIYRGHEHLGLLWGPDIVHKASPHRAAAFGGAQLCGITQGVRMVMGVRVVEKERRWECLSPSGILELVVVHTGMYVSLHALQRVVCAERPGRMPI